MKVSDLPANASALDRAELLAVHTLAMRNEVVRSAIQLVLRYIDVDSLSMDTDGMYAPRVSDALVKRVWCEFARSMLWHELMFGFMPFMVADTSEDCSVDPDWVAKHKGARDRMAADKRIKGPKYNDVFKIPIVPAFGTYDVYTWTDDACQMHVACIARRGDAEIQTLVYDRNILPHLDDGSAVLSSTLRALLESHSRLEQFKMFATTAAFTRSRPEVYVQFNHKDLNTKDLYFNKEYADAVVDETADVRTRQVLNEAAFAIDAEQEKQFASSQRALGASIKWCTDPSKLFTYAAQDALFKLPMMYTMAPQPRAAEMPTGIVEMEREFVEGVARLMIRRGV